LTAFEIAGVVCVGAALLVLAEVVVRRRIRKKGGTYVWAPRSKLLMHLAEGVLPSQGKTVRFDVNRDGERGEEPPRDQTNVYRVLVAGGSAAECYFLDQEDSWPEVLKRELRKPERLAKLKADAVHVGNIGKSLIGTEFIGRIFDRVFPRYGKIDCIVFMVGASNVVGWLMRGTPAVIDDSSPNSDVYDEEPGRPFGFSPARWALKERLVKKLRSGKPTVRHGAGKKLAAARAMRRRAETILETTPDPKPMLDHFDRHFRALVEKAKAKARRVVVVPQAWFDGPIGEAEAAVFWHGAQGQPYTGEVKTYYASDVVARLMRMVEERQVAICAELGVECMPLRPRLDHSLKSFYDFFHFTPFGAETTGRSLAEFMTR
jgi:hypothetical protein